MAFRIAIPATLALFSVASIQANEAALVLASQPNDQKAIEYAQSLVSKSAIRNVSEITFLRSSNGWLAISLGVFAKDDCNIRLAEIKSRAGVPKDAYCTPTQRFSEKYTFIDGKLQTSPMGSAGSSVSPSPSASPSATNLASSDAKTNSGENKSWNTLSADMARCADIAFRRNKSSINSMVQLGVSPDDPRIIGIINFCKDVTKMILRKDIDCDLQPPSGPKIMTKCDEEFVYVSPNGSKISLSFDDMIERRLENNTVTILQKERPDALEKRRSLEQKQQEEQKALAEQNAAAERQKNADLAAKRQEAEAEARRVAAEEAAKKRASGPLVETNDQGTVKGRIIFETKTSNYFSCDEVINPKLREATYALTSNLSKTMNVPLPKEHLCAVRQGKPGSITGITIYVNMYIDDASMQSCIYQNFCNDTRSVMLFPGKSGEVLFNTTVINAATRQTKQVCMNMKGDILSDQGCASVK